MSSASEHQEVDICCICMEGLNEEFLPSCSTCKKRLHFSCHIEYFKYKNAFHSISCPYCRGKLKYKNDDYYLTNKDILIENKQKDIEIKNI